MNLLRVLRNYYFYCGIEKDEYKAIKKDAYISNYEIWKFLHFLMLATFGILYIASMFITLLESNRNYYLFAFAYSAVAIALFFLLKKDSIAAQLLIYLSISILFLFGGFLSKNNPTSIGTTFIVFLLLMPMFMIDKPFFMTIELCSASTIFLIWMHGVKPHDVWLSDLVDIVIFTIVGNFLNIIANSIRIKEFVLKREISRQKDTDELTGLKNKGALTREINAFLTDKAADKGILFVMDVDRFKSINDTYGHDVGDNVIVQLANYLAVRFPTKEITGRFGGDEFIVFIKHTDDLATACSIANDVVSGVSEHVSLPDPKQQVVISIGIAIYRGQERNYSELFNKADTALYQAKADRENRFYVFKESSAS